MHGTKEKSMNFQAESGEAENLVMNGCVDYKGRVADKRRTGGWKVAPFIIVNEMIERLAFYAIAVNMVAYLYLEMHQGIPDAITHVTDWIGAAFVLTLLGAFLADAYLGRLLTILIFTCIYGVGMVMLTLSASLDSLRPPGCNGVPIPKCIPQPATTRQTAFLYAALYLIALGTGGIKPCVSTFGADQFDESDKKEAKRKYAFFNWFFFAINMGALLGLTLMVYVQQRKGWGWGFGVPTVAVFCSIMILLAGFRRYRYQKPRGSVFTRFFQVLVVSMRNHFKGVGVVDGGIELYEVKTKESAIVGARKLVHTEQYRFLDKAAVVTESSDVNSNNRWKLCTVTQVEEFKSFIRILPIWASTIALSISFAQLSTYFITQATFMDRKLTSHFKIPASSIPVFAAINGALLVPIYEKFFVPLLRRWTGHHRGISSLQRMGVGLFISIFALASAALVEKKRRTSIQPLGVSVFWLVPQFFLIGSAEVFTYVGQLEFFYDEATDGTRSISSALFLSEIGIGSWLSTALVKIIEHTTGGVQKGWLQNNINSGHLDYFYWVLTGINGLNFLVYLVVSKRHKGKGSHGTVADDSVAYSGGQGKNQNDHKEDFPSIAL